MLIREGLKKCMLERSCILIKYNYGNETFSLQPITKKDILKADKKLLSNKACIPAKIIKNFANCYCEKLKNIFNKWFQENKFPGLMKKGETTPVFLKS